MDSFKKVSIPYLFYKVDNLTCVAGHAALFSGKPTMGLTVYRYDQVAKDWALHRVWSCGLIALHHIGEGKSTDPVGWHLTFAKIKFKRIYKGLQLSWHLADMYRTNRKS